jgi:mono/diheme cytochrome c family protein
MKKRLIFLALTLAGCGGSSKPEEAEAPRAAPDPEFAAVLPVVEKNCGKCHNGVKHPLKFDSAAKLKGSKAKARITNGSMPPAPATISEADKATLLGYLK